jgi:hypothetical protein
MISLHVAIVVRSRDVRRIEINEIDSFRRKIENVAVKNLMPVPVVEYDLVEHLNLFKEVLLYGKPQVAPAVVISGGISGYREYAPGLFFKARPDQGCSSDSLPVIISQAFDIPADPVEKHPIFGIEENA